MKMSLNFLSVNKLIKNSGQSCDVLPTLCSVYAGCCRGFRERINHSLCPQIVYTLDVDIPTHKFTPRKGEYTMKVDT